ncbi:MAG: hypothetical protein AAF368_17265 [Planctomycetota bacterium]
MRNLIVASVLVLASCETVDLPEGLSFARQTEYAPAGPIISTTPDNVILFHPKGECRTPCRVDTGERIEVTLAREGYRPITLIVPPGAQDISFELTPVGRSTAVEEISLPEL